jgi:hypothetical protein
MQFTYELDNFGDIVAAFRIPKLRMKVAIQRTVGVVNHAIADMCVDQVPAGGAQCRSRCLAQQRQVAQIDRQPEIRAVDRIGQCSSLGGRADQPFLFDIAVEVLQGDVQPPPP